MSIDVDGLKSSVDLAALVGHYTPIKKRGAEYVARCVSHSPDDNPSMWINPRKGIARARSSLWPCLRQVYLRSHKRLLARCPRQNVAIWRQDPPAPAGNRNGPSRAMPRNSGWGSVCPSGP